MFVQRMNIIGQNGNEGEHYSELDLNKDGKIDQEEIKEIKKNIKEIRNEVGGNLLSHPEKLKTIQRLEKKIKLFEKGLWKK